MPPALKDVVPSHWCQPRLIVVWHENICVQMFERGSINERCHKNPCDTFGS